MINVDGTGIRWLTDNDTCEYGAAWSPDGTKSVYNVRAPGEGRVHDLFVMNAVGSRAVRLTDETTNDVTRIGKGLRS